jgi:hypothetical protein
VIINNSDWFIFWTSTDQSGIGKDGFFTIVPSSFSLCLVDTSKIFISCISNLEDVLEIFIEGSNLTIFVNCVLFNWIILGGFFVWEGFFVFVWVGCEFLLFDGIFISNFVIGEHS